MALLELYGSTNMRPCPLQIAGLVKELSNIALAVDLAADQA
jgi:hypothetical protein